MGLHYQAFAIEKAFINTLPSIYFTKCEALEGGGYKPTLELAFVSATGFSY
jgi:hypothetical protein